MKVSVLIPAYNEEPRVGKVIDAAFSSSLVDEVIVISDGSSDRTVDVALNHGAKVVELFLNQGKGDAIITGAKLCSNDLILLLDADLLGMTNKHIDSLIMPVLKKEADTSIGIFLSGKLNTTLAQLLAPYLSGQRVINKNFILNNITKLKSKGYAFETIMFVLVRKLRLREKVVFLKGSSQVTKEEKLGLTKGLYHRLKMYHQILKEFIRW